MNTIEITSVNDFENKNTNSNQVNYLAITNQRDRFLQKYCIVKTKCKAYIKQFFTSVKNVYNKYKRHTNYNKI